MSDQDQKSTAESLFKTLYTTSGTIIVGPDGRTMATMLPEADQKLEAEALALLDTFDGRLTDAEKRMERILARLGVE